MPRTNLQIEYLAITKILPALAKCEPRFALPEIQKIAEKEIYFYCKEDKIPLPLWIKKSERPDFLLTLPNGDSIGVEVTLAAEQARIMAEESGLLPNCVFMPPHLDNPNPSKKQIRKDAEYFIQESIKSIKEGMRGRDLSHALDILAKKLCETIKNKLKKAKNYRRCPENWLIIHDSTSEACAGGLGYNRLIPSLLKEAKQQSIEPFGAFERLIILNKEALIFAGSWDIYKIITVTMY